MENLLNRARGALAVKDGKQALALATQVLDTEESCPEAWLIAMKSFQLILPIDQYDPQNELTCGEGAIEESTERERPAVSRKVYRYYLTKIQEVLKRDADVLADGRSLLTYYQAKAYTSPSTAAALTRKKDEPLIRAVLRSFEYCKALFDAVPLDILRQNRVLNEQTRGVAVQWRMTYGYLEMRYEMVGQHLPRKTVEDGIRQYARFLRPLADGRDMIEKPLPFNTIHKLDQTSFWEWD